MNLRVFQGSKLPAFPDVMSWGPKTASESSNSPPKPQRSVSPLQSRTVMQQAVNRVVKTTAAMTRSISPKPLGTAQQVLGRAGKTASAAALARSASPRSASSVEWADHKKLKDIAKDLQRQLQRKEADASRLTDRVQKLIALRDEQLAESQAERRRLHYALEQEEVEVQRFRGRSCELQEALAAEVGARRRDPWIWIDGSGRLLLGGVFFFLGGGGVDLGRGIS